MRRFFRRVAHGTVFIYVFYYVMTRDLGYTYTYFYNLTVGALP